MHGGVGAADDAVVVRNVSHSSDPVRMDYWNKSERQVLGVIGQLLHERECNEKLLVLCAYICVYVCCVESINVCVCI